MDVEVAGLGPMARMADDVRQVLDQRAAANDIDQLHPAADAQHRDVLRECGPQQRELGRVALGTGVGRLRLGLGAVAGRVEVRAAGQHEPVDDRERLCNTIEDRGKHHRAAAGCHGALDVAKRDQCGRHIPCTPASRGDI